MRSKIFIAGLALLHTGVGNAVGLVDVGQKTLVTTSTNKYDERTDGCGPVGCNADLTRDGSTAPESRWSCSPKLGVATCTITYTFAEPQDIVGFNIAFHKGNERSRALAALADSEDDLGTFQSSGTTLGFETWELMMPELGASSITLISEGLGSTEWISLTEVEILVCSAKSIDSPIPACRTNSLVPNTGDFVDAGEKTTVAVIVSDFDDRTTVGCGPSGCVGTNTRDGSLDASSRWSCKGSTCEITYVFENPQDIVSMNIAFHRGNERKRTLMVLANDNIDLGTFESSGTTLGFENWQLLGDEVATLTLKVVGLGAGDFISITEVEFLVCRERSPDAESEFCKIGGPDDCPTVAAPPRQLEAINYDDPTVVEMLAKAVSATSPGYDEGFIVNEIVVTDNTENTGRKLSNIPRGGRFFACEDERPPFYVMPDTETGTRLASVGKIISGDIFVGDSPRGFCTAFLVAPTVAITAAHCIYSTTPDRWNVGEGRAVSIVFGLNGYTSTPLEDVYGSPGYADTTWNLRRAVTARIFQSYVDQPYYSSGTGNDLAIVELDVPMPSDSYLFPWVDWMKEGLPEFTSVAGYPVESQLSGLDLHFDFTLVARTNARNGAEDNVFDAPVQITGGNSGGPLFADGKSEFVLGVTSGMFSSFCGNFFNAVTSSTLCSTIDKLLVDQGYEVSVDADGVHRVVV